MPRQRFDDFSSNSFPFFLASKCFSISVIVAGRDRLTGNDAGFFARQNFLTGQTPHFGWRGRQTSAPRSRSAELCAAGAFFGVRVEAAFQSAFRPAVESIGIRKSSRRDKRREVFASIMATGRSKANA